MWFCLSGVSGSGKSTVLSRLKEMKFAVLSVDDFLQAESNREGKLGPIIQKIFGRSVFDEEGRIDQTAFLSEQRKNKLNKESWYFQSRKIFREYAFRPYDKEKQSPWHHLIVEDGFVWQSWSGTDYSDVFWLYCAESTAIRRILKKNGEEDNMENWEMAKKLFSDQKSSLAAVGHSVAGGFKTRNNINNEENDFGLSAASEVAKLALPW